MSVTIRDRGLVVKDPNSIEVFTMSWDERLADDAEITTSTWTLSPDDSVLTDDQDAILSGNRSTRIRLTGGTLGRKYTVTNRIVTDETPAQTVDASFFVLIQEQ